MYWLKLPQLPSGLSATCTGNLLLKEASYSTKLIGQASCRFYEGNLIFFGRRSRRDVE